MMLKLQNVTQLQSTDNFVWSKNDILGQGATSNVYKGREKVLKFDVIAANTVA